MLDCTTVTEVEQSESGDDGPQRRRIHRVALEASLGVHLTENGKG